MMKRFLPLILLVAGLGAGGMGAAGLALAMSSRPAQDDVGTRDRYRCFDPKFLRGFQTTGDNKVVITSDQNQAYELTLGGACIGLDSTFMIGIRSRYALSDICGPFDADIVYNDFGPRRCPIVAMRHLQGAEAEPYIYKRSAKSSSSDSGAKPAN